MTRVVSMLAALTTVGLLAACSADPTVSPPDSTGSSSSQATPESSSSTAASGTPSPDEPAVDIPRTITGLHVSGVQDGAWPDPNVPFGTLRLWDSGTAWSQVETARGQYNWSLLDDAVDNAEEHGVKDILLVLGSTPSWNAKQIQLGDYPVPGAASAPRSLEAWDAFVTAVVKRYKGRINGYQVWNEASLKMFWNGTPEKMAELTKRAADIIHAKDPDATVVAASTTVRLPGAFDRFFPRYLAALGALGWPVDVFAAHMYPGSRGTTDERAAFIAQVKDRLAEAGAPDLPVWDTELNYGLAGPGPTNPLTTIEGAEARDWVVQTTFDSLAMGIARTYWYIWTPEPYALLGMQLTNSSGAVKGLRIVDQWIVGSSTRGCTDDGVVVSCPLEKNGVPSIVAWAVNESGVLTAPAGLTRVCTTANKCTAITGPITLTETPVRLVP